jgi:ribosomal protein S18 acetylase RimI-like enzyme
MNTPMIELRIGSDLPFDQLLALYDSVGWVAYTNERRRRELRKAVLNSTYVVTAWSGEALIGLARGLSDDVSIFYLQDLLVHPAFQGKGIGKQLVNHCLERFKHVRSKVLLTDDDERQLRFYESLGFVNIKGLSTLRLNAFVQMDGMDRNESRSDRP